MLKPRNEVAVIVLVTCVARLGVAWWVSPTLMVGDEGDYFGRGRWLVKHGAVLANGGRPPLNEVLIGLLMLTGLDHPSSLRMVLSVLSSAICVPIYSLGHRMGGRSVARLAAVLCGLYPNFVAFSHYLWSESLYIFLLATSLWALARTLDDTRLVWPAVAGAVCGLTVLTREAGVPWVGLAVLWLAWAHSPSRRAQLRTCSIFLATVALVVAPWTIHLNSKNTGAGQFALITRTTYLNLLIGNGLPEREVNDSEGPLKTYYAKLGKNIKRREAAARVLAVESITERLPAWPLEKLFSEVPKFLTPGSFVIRRLLMPSSGRSMRWAYKVHGTGGPRSLTDNERSTLRTLSAMGFLIVASLGFAGLVLASQSVGARSVAWMGFAVIAGSLAPTLITFASSRFRFPAILVCILGLAWIAVESRSKWRGATPWARAAALLAFVGVLAISATRYADAFSTRWV